MRKKILFISALIVGSTAFANQTVGVGIYTKKSIYHAKQEVKALPIIHYQYKKFYLKNYKPGFVLYHEPNFNVSIIGDPLGGYSDFAIKSSRLKDGFQNIRNRNTQIMGGLAIDFQLDKTSSGHAEYLFGNHGSKGSIKLNKIIPIEERITFLPGITFNYFDSKYMNHYIGISEKEVKANNKIQNTFKAKDTVGAGINATVEFAVTEQLSASVFGGYEIYSSKIKKSDIVRDNKQSYVGIGLRYSF